jgi:hypothetical protein
MSVHVVDGHVYALKNRRPWVALHRRRRGTEADDTAVPPELGVHDGPVGCREYDLLLKEKHSTQPLERGGCVFVA